MGRIVNEFRTGLCRDSCSRCREPIWVGRTDQHNYCRNCAPPKKRVRRAFVTSTPGWEIRHFNKRVFRPTRDTRLW